MWHIIGIIAVLVVAFIAWFLMLVRRSARRRDERILKLVAPIGRKIDAGETVTPEEVTEIARRPETRFLLFTVLRGMDHPELIPPEFTSRVAQAECALVYWMMHPKELQDSPERIEHIETVTRSVDGRNAEFLVFRYKMADGHWASENGWILGIVGPMDPDAEPYSYFPGAFSRVGDIEGKITPVQVVDWYVDMLKKKGPAK